MIFVGSRTRTCKSKRNASGGHECVTPYTEPSLTFAADIWGRIARLKVDFCDRLQGASTAKSVAVFVALRESGFVQVFGCGP